MPLVIICPDCNRKFRVGDEFVGKPVTCPGCNVQTTATGVTVPPFDAFVSYSSKDKAMADAIVATLEADGIRCWVAPRDIVAGKEWSEAIIDGINNSRMIVLIFSANSNTSQQVLREVERAVHRGLPIVPFRIENLLPSRGMEYFISASHWLDAYHPPLDDHLRKLSATARALLDGMAAPHEEVPADIKGRLRAAVKSLTARDNRIRVLAGLVGLVFMIGLLAFAAVYALRPKVTPAAPAELVRAKANAEAMAEKVRGLNKGEQIGAKAEEVENHWRAGLTFFGERKFAKAGEHFHAVATLAPKVIEASRSRDELRILRADIDKLFEGARRYARKVTAAWNEIERKKQAAEKAYARGDFAAAAAAWNETRTRLTALQNNVDVIAEKKALAFWLGFAGRSLYEARHQDAMLAPRAKFMSGGFRPNDVSAFVTVLREHCKPRLGLKAELIDQLLTEPDNNGRGTFLSKTLPKAVRSAPELGREAQICYVFGHDLAIVLWGLDSFDRVRLHQELPPLPEVAKLFQRVPEFAALAGAQQEMLADLRRTQVTFEMELTASYNKLIPKISFAQTAKTRLLDIVKKYAATPDEAAKSFGLTLTRAGVPGQEAVLNELRRVRAAVYFDDPKSPRSVVELFLFAPLDKPARTLEAASALKSLRLLHLGWNPISDVDVANLATLTELRTLSLEGTRITDRALGHLKGMLKLERLLLTETAVTDSGLLQLSGLTGLKKLRFLDVRSTKVTSEGARKLQMAIPGLNIIR